MNDFSGNHSLFRKKRWQGNIVLTLDKHLNVAKIVPTEKLFVVVSARNFGRNIATEVNIVLSLFERTMKCTAIIFLK